MLHWIYILLKSEKLWVAAWPPLFRTEAFQSLPINIDHLVTASRPVSFNDNGVRSQPVGGALSWCDRTVGAGITGQLMLFISRMPLVIGKGSSELFSRGTSINNFKLRMYK